MSNVREFAEQLSDILLRIEDLKLEAAAVVDAAKEAGVDTKALKKVSKEMIMQSDKLARRFDDEEQIEMFRDEVGLRTRKGLRVLEAAQ